MADLHGTQVAVDALCLEVVEAGSNSCNGNHRSCEGGRFVGGTQ